MCVQFPVTVPINGVISCEDFDQNFQSLKAFVDAFCNLDEIIANIEMWATEAEASAEAALLALEQIETIQLQLQPLVDAITELLNLEDHLDDVLAVEAALTNINLVASNIADVNIVAAGIVNIGIVATNIANVNTVAGSIGNVNTVAGDIANVNIVAGDIANVNTVATNMTALLQIVTNLATILDASNQAAIAVQAALDAEQARDEIVAQIDFTGAVNGDLLQHNGSEFVRISREDLGAQKELFFKSLLGVNLPMPITSAITIWDNFASKSTSDPASLLSDSGDLPTMLIGSSFRSEIGRGFRANSVPSAFGYDVEIPNRGVINSSLTIRVGSTEEAGYIFWADSNNYFEILIRGTALIVNKCITGSKSQVYSLTLTTSYTNLALKSYKLDVILSSESSGGLVDLFVRVVGITPAIKISMGADRATWLTVNKIGLIMYDFSASAGGRPYFENMLLQRNI